MTFFLATCSFVKNSFFSLKFISSCIYKITFGADPYANSAIELSKNIKINKWSIASWLNRQIHSHSPPLTKVSMMICAPLKKSPNWASQRGSRFGVSMLAPYSNPSTASSDRILCATWKWQHHCSCTIHITKHRPSFLSCPYTLVSPAALHWFCLFYNHAKVSAFYRSSVVQGFLHYKFTVLHFSAPITFYFSTTDDACFTFSYLLLQHIFYVFRSVHVHDIICTSNKKCIYSAWIFHEVSQLHHDQ